MSDLQTEAKAAGVLDPDVLRLARAGLTVVEAVADLKARFPAAFGVKYRDMTETEQASFRRSLEREPPRPAVTKHVRDMTPAELVAFERSIGCAPSLIELQRRRRVAARNGSDAA